VCNEEIWNNKLHKVEEYIILNQKIPPISKKCQNTYILGKWISHQKENYKRGVMEKEYIDKWQLFINNYKELLLSNEEKWENRFNMLKLYVENNKKLPSQTDNDNEIKSLACWLNQQKNTKYKNMTGIMKDTRIRQQWEEFIAKYPCLF
jgi:hypothetical protein